MAWINFVVTVIEFIRISFTVQLIVAVMFDIYFVQMNTHISNINVKVSFIVNSATCTAQTYR